MNITYYLRDNGACGQYRVALPLQTMLRREPRYSIVEIVNGARKETIEESLKADITVIPRIDKEIFTNMVSSMKEVGMKSIADFDDDIFNVSPASPHYSDFGTEEVMMEQDGKLYPLWEDGKNINIERNRKKIDVLKKACESVDAISVTTEELGKAYKPYNDNIIVLPNCIDMNVWNRLNIVDDGTVRLVWFGGSSHYEDWFQIQDAIREVMRRNPQVKLVIMGAMWEKTLEGIEKSRIEFHPWCHIEAYPYKAATLNPHVCVIPLRDTEFNRKKSFIKWIEMSALQVPCVMPYIKPYSEIQQDCGIFVADNSPQSWILGMEILINDIETRNMIAGKAYKNVQENFDINTQWIQWKKAYEKLLNITYWEN